LDVVHNWPSKLPQIISLYCPDQSIVILKPQNGLGGVQGLNGIFLFVDKLESSSKSS
jgi:hypothetical protein